MLARVYADQPALLAERALVRADEEAIFEAQADYYPRLTAELDYGYRDSASRVESFEDGQTHPRGLGLTATQKLFDGFRTSYGVASAEAAAAASREDLRATTQRILLAAATAFSDVLRDRAVLAHRAANVQMLLKVVDASRRRLALAMGTKTDLAQAEARLAQGVSLLEAARAALAASSASFQRYSGEPPGVLSAPAGLQGRLPGSLEEALSAGLSENPEIAAELHRFENRRTTLQEIQGQLLPSVDLEARYERRVDGNQNEAQREDALVIGRVTVPLTQGGSVHAQLRQARERLIAGRGAIADVRASVRSQIVERWSELHSAKSRAISTAAQVAANLDALNGVTREEELGQRSVLDVLDANGELVESQIVHLMTEREITVASYALLAAVGRLGPGTAARGQEPQVHDLSDEALSRLTWTAVVRPASPTIQPRP